MEKLKAIIKKYDDITCSPDIRAIIDGCKELIDKNNELANACTNNGKEGSLKDEVLYWKKQIGFVLSKTKNIDCWCDAGIGRPGVSCSCGDLHKIEKALKKQ